MFQKRGLHFRNAVNRGGTAGVVGTRPRAIMPGDECFSIFHEN